MVLKRSETAANAAVLTMAQLCDGGALELFTGRQPATPDVPLGVQRRLVSITLPDPAFHLPDGGIAELADVVFGEAEASGTASWFRVSSSDRTPLWDGKVGDGPNDLLVDEPRVLLSAKVRITKLSIEEAKTA